MKQRGLAAMVGQTQRVGLKYLYTNRIGIPDWGRSKHHRAIERISHQMNRSSASTFDNLFN